MKDDARARAHRWKERNLTDADEETVAAAMRLARNRTPLHVDDFPVILFYSQKSGCTSAIKWFFWQTGLLEEAKAFANWIHIFEHQVFKRTPGYRKDLIATLCRGDKRRIKFTRNPYQRAVSSFLMLSGRQLSKADYFGHAEWRKIRAYRYGDPDDRRGISFRDFLLFLRDGLAAGDHVNGHFAPQFRADEQPFNVEYYRLESMSATFRMLERDLGLRQAPDALLSSGHHRSYKTEAEVDASLLEIDENTFVDADPPSYRAFYAPETLALAQEVFADDISRYDYPASIPA